MGDGISREPEPCASAAAGICVACMAGVRDFGAVAANAVGAGGNRFLLADVSLAANAVSRDGRVDWTYFCFISSLVNRTFKRGPPIRPAAGVRDGCGLPAGTSAGQRFRLGDAGLWSVPVACSSKSLLG